MFMKTLGIRLKTLRKEMSFKSQSAFGKAIGVSHVTISAWERDEYKPSGDHLYKILDFTGVRKNWLYDGAGEKMSNKMYLTAENDPKYGTDKANLGHIDSWDSSTPLDDDEVELPFFRDVELAAGAGAELTQENHGPKLRFSKSTLRNCGVDPYNAACVKVSGNSMEPRLLDGDVVGVNLGDKRIVDGKTYAINHDGLLRIKRLYMLPGGGLRINSFNAAEHPDEILNSDERLIVLVIGKVFWSSSIWN
jgi:phage repressor protein C with HTH and peptisase S24 domain